MSVYKKSTEFNYYYRDDALSISYSDGSDVENKLFDIIKNIKDKSSLSDELTHFIDDWPTEYHFSKSRHCLLRPLKFNENDNILELGCGCGAITRYLGETGANVDAVEGTYSRARIAAERCSDLTNVNIFVDDLLKFESKKLYDWVLFIGVLEYAPMFSCETDAVQHYLNEAKKHLKPSGKLVVAIENKLGLKYFNGCAEDHVNEPYFGLENRYSEKTPITFGKNELKQVLNNSGFKNLDFYYPFPDYKLPSVIFNDNAFSAEDFDAGEILRGIHSRDYTGGVYRAFNESFVWNELFKNNLIQDLSNSFLVIANNYNETNELAWHYNTRRKKEYVTETKFTTIESKIHVEKNLLCKITKDKKIRVIELKEEYINAYSLQTKMEILWHKNHDFKEIIILYQTWFNFLLKNSNYLNETNIENIFIDSTFFDSTPFNIKIKNDTLYPFDQEWDLGSKIPLLWVVFRGIYWSLQKFNTIHSMEINLFDIIKETLESKQIKLHKTMLIDIYNKEKIFIKQISGSKEYINDVIYKYPSKYSDLYLNTLNPVPFERKNQILSEELEKHKDTIKIYERFLPLRAYIALRKRLKNV